MDVDLKYVVLRAGRVGGTDDLVFNMNIELVCVQVIIGTKGEQGSQLNVCLCLQFLYATVCKLPPVGLVKQCVRVCQKLRLALLNG